MEQGVFEGDIVLLRFKFMTFFDLNPKVTSYLVWMDTCATQGLMKPNIFKAVEAVGMS